MDQIEKTSRVMKSKPMARGFVYVISAPNGYLKIGSALNPIDRYRTIRCNSPLPVTFEYACECRKPVEIEVAAHRALDERRRHQEWFESDVATAIEAVRSAIRATGHEPRPSLPRVKAPGTCGAPITTKPANIAETSM